MKDATRLLIDEEAAKLINEDEPKPKALANAERNGVVLIAEIADHVNERTGNIGARCLHTVRERLLENVS